MELHRLFRVGAAVLLIGLVAVSAARCAGPGPRAVEACPEDPLLDAVRETGSLRLLVHLDLDVRPEAELDGEAAAEQRRTIAQLQHQLVRELEGTGAQVVRLYQRFPLMALEVTEPALCRLLISPLVRTLEVDREDAPGSQ